MSEKNRDTQFLGFGRLVMKDLLGNAGYIDIRNWDHEEIEEYAQDIARRAYDLVGHTLKEVYEQIDIEDIPDLTVLPEVPNE